VLTTFLGVSLVDPVEFLVAQLALVLPVEVSADTDGKASGEPWLAVRAQPGGREISNRVIRTVIVNLEAYGGGDPAEVSALCRLAVDACQGLRNIASDGVLVTRVECRSTPYRDDDLFSGEVRWTAVVEVFYRRSSAGS
jgi:hypothetical protein